MSKLIHQPHDKLVKQSLSDIRVMNDFCKAHLPPSMLNAFDLNTLKLKKNTFISPEYKDSESDVLYTVQLEGSTAYIYLLCEHQTEVDPLMSLRLLHYMIRIWELHIKQHPKDTLPLPLIYPMVLYGGKSLWDAPLTIFELFGNQQERAQEWFLSPYNLIDLHRINDNELQRHMWAGLFEFALKYRKTVDYISFLEKVLHWIQKIEVNQGTDYNKTVLEYLISGIDAENSDLFLEKSAQYLSSKLQGEVMTLAQKFEQKGRREGIEEIARNLLKEGVPVETIHKCTGLPVASIKKLNATQN